MPSAKNDEYLSGASYCAILPVDDNGGTPDDSSRRVMIHGGAIAATALGWLIPDSSWLGWVVIPAYFILSIAHARVRLGRKTYLVDMAGGNNRTDYVAVSNTAIGFALLALGMANPVL